MSGLFKKTRRIFIYSLLTRVGGEISTLNNADDSFKNEPVNIPFVKPFFSRHENQGNNFLTL